MLKYCNIYYRKKKTEDWSETILSLCALTQAEDKDSLPESCPLCIAFDYACIINANILLLFLVYLKSESAPSTLCQICAKSLHNASFAGFSVL